MSPFKARASFAEAPASTPQEPQRDVDVIGQPCRLSEDLPKRLSVADMCRVFGIGPSRFHRLARAGRFDRFVLRPKVGRTAWSGRLVQAYLDGEVVPAVRSVRKRA